MASLGPNLSACDAADAVPPPPPLVVDVLFNHLGITDPWVVFYFSLLACGVWFSFSGAGIRRKSIAQLLSFGCISVTWWLIFRFFRAWGIAEQTGAIGPPNYGRGFFADAYIDALSTPVGFHQGDENVVAVCKTLEYSKETLFNPLPAQLLLWVTIISVWVLRLGGPGLREGTISLRRIAGFWLYGMLGAMSASFLPLVMLDESAKKSTGSVAAASFTASRRKRSSVPFLTLVGSLATLFCFERLRGTVGFCVCGMEDGCNSFVFYLHALHFAVLIPFLVEVMEYLCIPFYKEQDVPTVSNEGFIFTFLVKNEATFPRVPVFAFYLVFAIVVLFVQDEVSGTASNYATEFFFGTNGSTALWTDCRISMYLDFVFCWVLSLKFIVYDSWCKFFTSYFDSFHFTPMTAKRFSNILLKIDAEALALIPTAIFSGLVLAGFLSPCVALALHLGIADFFTNPEYGLSALVRRFQGMWALRQQQLAGENSPCTEEKQWMNIGCSKEIANGGDRQAAAYASAAENLADMLGQSLQLDETNKLLCCGCGYGEELRYFSQKYRCKAITGLEIDGDFAGRFSNRDRRVRMLQGATEDLAWLFGANPGQFDTAVALDSIYHFSDKSRFIEECGRKLLNVGSIGLTDFVAKKPLPHALALALRVFCNIHSVWSLQGYREALRKSGFEDVEVTELEGIFGSTRHADGGGESGAKRLFGTACRSPALDLLPNALREACTEYLSYVVIVGRISPRAPAEGTSAEPGNAKPRAVVPFKIAVVGSGIAGLAAASELQGKRDSSGRTFQVSLFEAQPDLGLASAAAAQVETCAGSAGGAAKKAVDVDVPLRMLVPGHYTSVLRLLHKHQVKSENIFLEYCDYKVEESGVTLTGETGRKKAGDSINESRRGVESHTEESDDDTSLQFTRWSAHLARRLGYTEDLAFMRFDFRKIFKFLVFSVGRKLSKALDACVPFRESSNFLSKFSMVKLVEKRLFYQQGENDSDNNPETRLLSVGEYLVRHGFVSVPCQDQASDGDVSRYHDDLSRQILLQLPRDASLAVFVYGAAWMLSCSEEQVVRFPAKYLIDYYETLIFSSLFGLGTARRVCPSMKGLENALAFGLDKIATGKRVQVEPIAGADASCVLKDSFNDLKYLVDGEEFDAVVVAVDPAAVSKVLDLSKVSEQGVARKGSRQEQLTAFFAKIQTQWSDAVLHHDRSLLPKDEQKWGVLNVLHDDADLRQDDKRSESDGMVQSRTKGPLRCQLTVYLNKFFGWDASQADNDFFITWNVRYWPSAEQTLLPERKIGFHRVLHDAQSVGEVHRRLAANLEDIVPPGVFICGAYSVPGVGLLEEGVQSGQRAARGVEAFLRSSSSRRQ
eukprot:TRINITY_DN34691_c0_g1_i1.p1 TRINITY_DN34691_c0_g1~~TRINITY_DN34691_c0_g1_i1.p1  ORF type:complete len:1357 (-),score=153.86 TRINITY_DN34691_c0_g1_i1:211-4281(-)